MSEPLSKRLSETVDNEADRSERADRAAEMIRQERGFRWVGIYDVGDDVISIVGYTDSKIPAHQRFAASEGLSGEAVRLRRTVISNDVARDPRYLNAFASAGSEVIVPVLGAESGVVIGTLDVESDRINAFSPDDVDFLEECAAVLRPLYD